MDSGDERPVTSELLADLQAGLLDEETAACLRRRIRTDPQAAQMMAALAHVRRDLAELGADEASAPDVPAEVTARVGAALQAEPPHRVDGSRLPPTHAVRGSVPRLQVIALVAGIGAALAGVVVGAFMLTRDPAPTYSAGPTAKTITVSRPARDIPLSGPQIADLLFRGPDYGPLADPQRRAACLSGLGYSSATEVLGARPLDVDGRPGVLMLLPSDSPRTVVALVVAPNCNSAHTGLLANTVVTRP